MVVKRNGRIANAPLLCTLDHRRSDLRGRARLGTQRYLLSRRRGDMRFCQAGAVSFPSEGHCKP